MDDPSPPRRPDPKALASRSGDALFRSAASNASTATAFPRRFRFSHPGARSRRDPFSLEV